MARQPRDLGAAWPGVSILKPLKGTDAGLIENLRSFFCLDYPSYEILFSVAESCDPAIAIVHALLAEYPQVKARLIIGGMEATPNPKVNNLLIPYDQAANDLLLVSDSNIRVEPAYLRRMVGELQPDVGVVTSAVVGKWAESLGGRLESCYLNTFYARCMHFADSFSLAFVLGKSMLFRRSVADRFGGLRHLGNYVAEDYLMGQAVRRLGLRVAVTVDPVPQYIGSYTVGSFWKRHLRWGRIRRAQVPFLFLLELFQSAITSAVVGALAFHRFFGWSFGTFFAVHFLLWFLADSLLQRRLVGKLSLSMIPTWLLREGLALPHWVHMAVGSRIEWRGARLRVLGGGLLEGTAPAYFEETGYPRSGLASE